MKVGSLLHTCVSTRAHSTVITSLWFCLLQKFRPSLPELSLSPALLSSFSCLLLVTHPCPSPRPSVLIPVRLYLSINSPPSLRHPLGFCFAFHFATCHRLLPVMSRLLRSVMDDGCSSQILAAYKALMERLLSMLGAEDPTQKSKEIIQLETRLANVSQMCSRARPLCT